MNLSPYNLLVVVAAVVVVGLAGLVFLLGNKEQASGFVAFATPLLVVLVSIINAYQNNQQHKQNTEKIDEIRSAVERKD